MCIKGVRRIGVGVMHHVVMFADVSVMVGEAMSDVWRHDSGSCACCMWCSQCEVAI